jgi:phage gp45-like
MTVPLNPFIYEGQVVQTDDPDQMGRVKVWIPALDGEEFEIERLPWAEYAPPLGGFTVEYPAGSSDGDNSHAAYGFWAIPKMGATVLCLFLGGDPRRRLYFASTLRLHRNRSLPVGRNADGYGKPGPFGDAGDDSGLQLNKMEPGFTNLREQFQNQLTESEAVTRGVYERQVAQPKFEKDGSEGYSKTPVAGQTYLDSQTYCFVTPGRNAMIMQDDPAHARLRMKTANGHQVIFDDANERIYISTDKGKSWLEMDSDGHVHVFGAASFSVRATEDINLSADGEINLEAKKGINIKAGDDIKISTAKSLNLTATKDGFFSVCGNLNLFSEKTIYLTSDGSFDVNSTSDVTISAGREMDLKSNSSMKLGGSRIDLNGPTPRTAEKASCGIAANGPTVIPGHEPWKRPASKATRGKNWKA